MNAVRYLNELLPFPSISSVSNADVSRCLLNQLSALGCRTEWSEYQDDSGVTKVCVSGRLGPDQGHGVAYFCHSDVVPVASWSFPHSGPWQPLQQDGRIYGRGSCDMKGSAACMLAAMEAVGQQSLKQPVYFVCTADEEIGLMGARHLVEHSAMYREIVANQCRGIVGEPTLLDVVHAHKGGRALKITAQGRAAHSSTGKGVNANMAMIPFLAGVREICLEIEGHPDWQDQRYDPPTINLNLGINDFNYALNITAAQSVCTIYFRTMPAIDADQLMNRLLALAASCSLQTEILFATEPLFTDPQSDYVQELLRLRGAAASRTVAYGTDGACFHELNDLVVFGPGDIRQAHTDDEWISLEQLDQGTSLYEKLIRHWCC
ncbi:MAG: M20 family metallopeptidase [Planctomycetaceae bacterium]